jgi:hypothetical protein
LATPKLLDPRQEADFFPCMAVTKSAKLELRSGPQIVASDRVGLTHVEAALDDRR